MSTQQVWLVAPRSSYASVEDIFERAEEKPIIVGVNDVGGTSFMDASVSTHIAGLPRRIVAGYSGSGTISLAAMRGEVDMIVLSFESVLPQIEAGDLRPILQVSVKPIGDHPSLAGVPQLGGDDGIAARRAAEAGRDVAEAKADAAALAALLGAGRIVVAPRGIEPAVAKCMEDALQEALAHPGLIADAKAAKRSLDVERGEATARMLASAAERGKRFMPVYQAAIEQIRE